MRTVGRRHAVPRRRHLLLCGPALWLSACGFELRRSTPSVPFRSLALVGFAPTSPLAAVLRQQLAAIDLLLVDDPARAEAVLEALADARERSVVASTAAGQVRELQLRVRLRFRLATPAGRLLLPADELVLTRDMSYNETLALAKATEETLLYRAMEDDIVAQVLRRLSAVPKR